MLYKKNKEIRARPDLFCRSLIIYLIYENGIADGSLYLF